MRWLLLAGGCAVLGVVLAHTMTFPDSAGTEVIQLTDDQRPDHAGALALVGVGDRAERLVERLLDQRGRLWLLGRCAARIDDARGRLYPLGVESIALRRPGVRRAAFVGHHGRRVLVLEPTHRAPQPDLSRLAQDLAWAHVDEILLDADTPVDARHNAKVDYRALAARLNERSGLGRVRRRRSAVCHAGAESGSSASDVGNAWPEHFFGLATLVRWVP